MKKIGLNFLIFIILPSFIFAEQLSWKMNEGDRLEMVKTANVEYLINSRVAERHLERNIIDLTCLKKNKKSQIVKGTFSIFAKSNNDPTYELQQQYESEFSILFNGVMQIPEHYEMPNLRNLPTFPQKELKIGDHWQAMAEIIFNNFTPQIKLSFPVEYKLLKIKQEKEQKIAIIQYQFRIEKDIASLNVPANFPQKIIGQDQGLITWNLTKNIPINIDENYHMYFLMREKRNSLVAHEYRMYIKTQNNLYHDQKTDLQKEKNDLQKELAEEKDLAVVKNKRGLVIRLDNILFDFDSAQLSSKAKKQLAKIKKVLQEKYPDREIIVEGHTDSIGDQQYNLKLSQKRAENVASYLKEDFSHDKFSYQGKGSQVPLASNKNPKGRQKNRRVEIIIKLK